MLAKSRKELNRSMAALKRMKEIYAIQPIDADAYEAAWFEFLGAIERIWYKFLSQTKHHPKRHSWIGIWESERKKEPLLSFLSKSRGAEEHSHIEVVGRGPDIREITKVNGPMHYKDVNGTLVPAIVDGESYTIHYDPKSVQLKAIKYRGQAYDVPKEHLGKKILYPTPIVLAELGIAFYTRFINDAEAYFFPVRRGG